MNEFPMEELLEQLIGTDAIEISPISQPEYILSGSGFGWFYSDAKRTMVRVTRGSECILFEDELKDNNHVIAQVGSEILSIPSDEIIELGWN